MKKRGLSKLLIFTLLFSSLWGCGGSYKDLRLDLTGGVYSLDPQFATGQTSKIILKNTMEGLLVQRADGTLEPGVAQEYRVSPDGLTYTFILREDAKWQDGGAVTAADFQYALRRLFTPGTPSPHAGAFSGILGAAEILAGEKDPSELGVEAPDDHTLVIRLAEPSPLILTRLAETGALPCRRDFFEGTRARYGLEAEYFLSNGPFVLKKWDNEKAVTLEKNEGYWDAAAVNSPSVTFYVGREDPKKQFLDGKADAYQLTHEDVGGLGEKFTYQTRENTVWSLVFNQSVRGLDDPRVRRALTGAIDRSGVGERIPQRYTITDSLVPRDTVLFGQRYRDLAPVSQPAGYRPQEARASLQEWLDETETDALSGLTIMLPQSGEMSPLGGYFQRMWKDGLSVYVNLDVADDGTYERRLAAGEFQMALAPVVSGAQGPQGTLAAFVGGGPGNLTGYANEEYDALLAQALVSSQVGAAAQLYVQAEALLAEDAVALPLFSEPSYFAQGKGVAGAEFFDDGVFYLKYAGRR